MLTKAYIPYRGYYSTPFARWQGRMANENAVVLAAETSKRWLAAKRWDPQVLDYLILGMTIGFSGVALVAAGVYVIGTSALLAALRDLPH